MGESHLQMSSNVTSQATAGSLGKPGTELSQTSSGGVCPCLYLHLGLQPPDFPENKSLWLYPAEGLYCSNPGEHIE